MNSELEHEQAGTQGGEPSSALIVLRLLRTRQRVVELARAASALRQERGQ